ncbi:heavy metal translocating P-type ATPase [Salinibacter grassmerensis]|uniref:heavy metal translocating P-type ATPase n=1 Tax=Salinibacter grassmerensis TaxID=3040353 RepID=UPI0021E96B3C|nr:heavy metal translocating P-type ATPase [Salinibacter grassmerensis]
MAKQVQLDLPIVLPTVPDAEDACVDRLTSSLHEQDGVSTAHVSTATNGAPDRLCIHYDPDAISLPQIRRRARSLGTELTDQYGHLSWTVDGISHPRRARTLARRLRQIEGVVEAGASAAEQIRVEYDRSSTSEDEICAALRSMNVRPRGDRLEAQGLAEEAGNGQREAGHDHDHGGIFGEKTELIFALTAGVCVALGVGLSFANGVPGWIPWGLYIGAYAFSGYYTVREAVDTLRAGEFEVDFLMIVAAGGAAVLGKWLEGAFLLFLFSLGHSLEHYAMRRARRAIESLADLAPDTALVRRNETEQEVSVDDLTVGDVVIVKPNERVPADGVVLKGESAVNQAPVTGESVPVDKTPVEAPPAVQDLATLDAAHRVYAGTINGSGVLEVRVTKRADETTISRVVQLVTEAEAEKSPTERFTDRFERVFVPAVLGLVGLLLFAWVPLDEPFADSFYRAMAVLVAASPCALAIATPSAVLSALARAGQGGVLVKGGGPLEHLGRLGAVAFDKTGTLTTGKPRVTDVRPCPGVREETLLRTAVAAEQLSDHPLAEAVVQYGEDHLGARPPEDATEMEGITGRGVRAFVGGVPVHVGKQALFDEIGGPPPPDTLREEAEALEADGRTTMIVRRGGTYLGVMGLADTPRPEATNVVGRLRRTGIRRMVVLSGDNQRVVDAVAEQLGLDEARGDLLPTDKVDAVRTLRQNEDVAMVGDGVNDAPAMANATVGIAMGAAGSDAALETADVALMADDLSQLPFAVGLSRQTRRVITQNLWIALGMVAVLVPATIAGLPIGPAVVLHEGSTLLVVGNALRLLRYDS